MLPRRKYFLFQSLIVISVFQLSSCTSLPKIDSDLLGNKNCAPPCWMSIQPGVTNTNDAITILENLDTKENKTLKVLANSINWRSKTEKNYSLSIDNNLVAAIKMQITTATIADIVKLFGNPEHFLIDTIEHNAYTALLLYPNKGLVFRCGANARTTITLTSDLNIINAIYSKPGALTDMLKVVYGKNYDNAIIQHVHKWTGYGKVP